ncbi:MAG: C39 family peptidase [Patescibacteria group bacterium]
MIKNKLTLIFAVLLAMAIVYPVNAATVPFLVQAPFGNWGDPRLAQGCEEAAALMAVAWAKGQTSISPYIGRKQIIAISNWEKKNIGYYQDTSIQDTADYILKRYLGFTSIEVRKNIATADIISEIQNGNILLVAIDGRKIGSPYYRKPAPLQHTILVYGYDLATDSFIVNDPGTIHGAGWNVPQATMQASLQDYPTGNGSSRAVLPPAMIIVKK